MPKIGIVQSPLKIGIYTHKKPERPSFEDRKDAGQKLGIRLIEKYGEALNDAVIIGCIRGGLVTAHGVLDTLEEDTCVHTYPDFIPGKEYWDIEDYYDDFTKLTDEDAVQIIQDYNGECQTQYVV